MSNFTPPDPSIWQGRNAPEGDYWFQKVRCMNWSTYQDGPGGGVAILGYAVHAGVRLNQGRIGAAAGPKAIRAQVAKLANHLPDETLLYDLGEIICPAGDVAAAQRYLAFCTTTIQHQKSLPVLLGGGHDIAYAHYRGTTAAFPSQRIGFINFDAHFDLRPDTNGPTSGTPFYQLAREAQELGDHFPYLVLGIQLAASPPSLVRTAEEFGVDYKIAAELIPERIPQNMRYIDAFLSDLDGVCLTIDLDGFSSAYAPGVSAPSPLGFSPEGVFPLIEHIAASGKLLSMDVAEMNPTYDQDTVTAKLAARCIERVVSVYAQRS